ncbi:Crp/Fnr family transcriptional regulator [Leptothoe kymatousa]|uniref:Crp/Fnr family transcriptional regulator n=1 Tax=Leptothoe kymatousa TAU-MAC 1615 TaxID=2364775 RepID=A0ABS5Y5B1_9CYAN|nr:Crp/Fnr family transcriptional regulator [Leptothoe kymatousa]MBT9313016.1 Crp/Fnr family transcriptional regulator [Leptothoe kymatousa TAU-MAC 1615]
MSASQLTHRTRSSDQYIALLEELYHERNLTHFPAGQSIPLRRGEIYIICRGIVQLHTIHPDGSETLLGLAGPSMPFGLSLTSVTPYWATALTKIDVLPLSMAELENSPTLMAGLFSHLSRRLQQTEAWLALSGKRLVADRLRQLLIMLAQEFGQVETQGVKLTIRLTHHQLATTIGTTRVTVTRLLRDFRNEGWLKIHQRYLILPLSMLQEMSEHPHMV